MIPYLYGLAVLSLIGGAALGFMAGDVRSLIAWCVSGMAGFITAMWMAEVLLAARRAATAVERLVAKADIAERQ